MTAGLAAAAGAFLVSPGSCSSSARCSTSERRCIVPVVEALVVWFVLNAMANGLGGCRWSGRGCPGGALLVSAARGPRARRAGGAAHGRAPSPASGRAPPGCSRRSTRRSRGGGPAARHRRRGARSTALLDGLGLESMVRQVVAGDDRRSSATSASSRSTSASCWSTSSSSGRKLRRWCPTRSGARRIAGAVRAGRAGHPDLSLGHDAGQRADRRRSATGPAAGRASSMPSSWPRRSSSSTTSRPSARSSAPCFRRSSR